MASANRNLLKAEKLTKVMASSLPPHSTPSLSNPFAAVAIFGHACMLSVGFRLVGLGEDHKIGADSKPSDPEPLPEAWDSNSTFAFRYKHLQSSMEYLLKVSRLGGKAVVFGIALGDDRTASFDVSVKDYVSESAFPFKQSPGSDSDKQKALQDLFISPNRLNDLSSLFFINIIQKLAPGLGKGTSEVEDSPPVREVQEEQRRRPERDPLREDPILQPARPYPYHDPLAAPPRRPFPAGEFAPPGFEDEYDINRPPGGLGGYGERRPLNIGERDLYPPGLGPHDPLRGGIGGPGGLPVGIGGGGMHPTFDDPLFAGRQGEFYDPRAPPGARYDPVGPGDGPPNLRGPRFPGGGFGGPAPGGGFGGPGGGFPGGFGGGIL